VEKNILPISRPNLSPETNSAWFFNGHSLPRFGQGVVVGTAENTEFGKIAKLVKSTSKVATPLQRKIAQFTKTLMIAIFILGALIYY